jgi:hypothetical protein
LQKREQELGHGLAFNLLKHARKLNVLQVVWSMVCNNKQVNNIKGAMHFISRLRQQRFYKRGIQYLIPKSLYELGGRIALMIWDIQIDIHRGCAICWLKGEAFLVLYFLNNTGKENVGYSLEQLTSRTISLKKLFDHHQLLLIEKCISQGCR